MPPKDGFKDFLTAVDEARRVESAAVILYTRFSRYLVGGRRKLADAKLLLKTKKGDYDGQEFLAYEDRRKALKGYEDQVEESQEEVHEIMTFIDCVERLLSLTKHFREDLSKRLKALEIERGITGG